MAKTYEKALKTNAVMLSECQGLAPTITEVAIKQSTMIIHTSDSGLSGAEILSLAAYNPFTVNEIL